MKSRNIIFAAIFIGGVISMESCKKYSDGPMCSLRSREERVANAWKIEKLTKNSVDITTGTSDKVYEFKKDGSFIYTSDSKIKTGTWAFINQDEQLDINISDPFKWKILRLKEKEMWCIENDGSDILEFHLIPK